MGVTNAAGIWTPDEFDKMDPEVWSAAMADSIMNGLGERMNKQEQRVSLRATAPDVFDVVSTTGDTVPMVVPLTVGGYTGSRDPEPDFAPGNHANGIEMEGGYALIQVSGFYNITGQITLRPGPTGPDAWDFIGATNTGIFGLPDYGATTTESYSSGRVFDTRYLTEGDTVYLQIGVGLDHIGSLTVQDAMLSLALIYAT
jgi:hypothetical protein